MQPFVHETVLAQAAITALDICPSGTYVDCTLGGAGHSARIAAQLGSTGMLIGIDQDAHALAHARTVLAPYAKQTRITLVHANFRHIAHVLADCGVQEADGVLFDLGVSSPQLDDRERGFSYWDDAPLDMRMDRTQPTTAAHIVNTASLDALTRILRDFGEEQCARRIAARIVHARASTPIERAGQLVRIVKEAIPAAQRRTGGHPARRTFQALRIAVNDELAALSEALDAAVHALRPAGRIVAIAFHSLEDRICKKSFQNHVQRCNCPPRAPQCVCGMPGQLCAPLPKKIVPDAHEIARNARARSATLRYAIKANGATRTI
jgi:16S rRNA (cytosine1402-N4)-methyltransferase